MPAFRRRAAGVVLLAVVLTFGGGAARAATVTVNSASDSTDGTCGPAPDGCTLREAIEAAVATPGRDAIGFDPATFPPAGTAPSIVLQTPLPVIADPAGTVIDGKGATVFIDGGGQPRALVFASAAGVPLTKVTVANLVVVNVTGIAIEVCGGVSPDCDEDVTAVLVQQVVASGMNGGIAVLGDVVSKIRVVGAAVSVHQEVGIAMLANRALLGARVEGSTVLGGTGGIRLAAGERVAKAAVVDSVAAQSLRGIRIQGPEVSGTKIADVVTTQNGDGGTRVLADGANVGTTITNVGASAFGANGVEVVGGPGSRALTIRNVTADRGRFPGMPDGNGIGVQGPFDGAVLTNLALIGNGVGLSVSSEGTSFLHAKLSDVRSGDNSTWGIGMFGEAAVMKEIHSSANELAGIVVAGAAGHVVQKCRAMGNGSVGIVSEAANVIEKNVALGNKVDLSDDSPTCATNVWQKNVFRTGSAPCIR